MGREAEGEEKSEDVRGLANKIVAKGLSRRAIEEEEEEQARLEARRKLMGTRNSIPSNKKSTKKPYGPHYKYQPYRIFLHLFYVRKRSEK